MLKKIEKSRLFLEQHLEKISCPICQSSFSLSGNALVCQKRHTYNLNKKGTVNFLSTKADSSHYTRKMFEPRRRLIQAGMYQELLKTLQGALEGALPEQALLDIGTGEGTFLQQLDFPGAKFAFDIAKDGIDMASELDMAVFLSLADLTRLPYATGSMHYLLNILTPSNYGEFKRVMAPTGRLIKVIPDKFYLRELREVYGLALEHDNSAVMTRFAEEFPQFEQLTIQSVFDIPEALRADFLDMSPLEWAVSEEQKARVQQAPPHTATIHLQVLIADLDKNK